MSWVHELVPEFLRYQSEISFVKTAEIGQTIAATRTNPSNSSSLMEDFYIIFDNVSTRKLKYISIA